jgi:2-hydroxychromene-2-carboxylate isomerase
MDAETVMRESEEWQRIMGLPGETTLEVFFDIKSPHAYLAVRPSLAVARDFRVNLDFQPFTLSYEAFGLTTKVDDDMRRRPPSPAADRKARMYYAAAREYAAMQSLPFRSPHRLLDSELSHRAFLFAKQQKLEVPFLMFVYLEGWGSGWRDFELESEQDLRRALQAVGVSLDGFTDYVADGGEGERQLSQSMKRAEETGYSGVPHYVFSDTAVDREVGLFGREHLALIRGKYAKSGLSRNDTVVAEFSHAWNGPL